MLMNMFGVRIMFINNHKTNHENVQDYACVCVLDKYSLMVFMTKMVNMVKYEFQFMTKDIIA